MAAKVKLTADELAAARAAGMTPAEYQAFKSPHPDPAAIEAAVKRDRGDRDG